MKSSSWLWIVGLILVIVGDLVGGVAISAVNPVRSDILLTAEMPSADVVSLFSNVIDLGAVFAAIGIVSGLTGAWRHGSETPDDPDSDDSVASAASRERVRDRSLEETSVSAVRPGPSPQSEENPRTPRRIRSPVMSAGFWSLAILLLLLAIPVQVYAVEGVPALHQQSITLLETTREGNCTAPIWSLPHATWNLTLPPGADSVLRWSAPESGNGVGIAYNGGPIPTIGNASPPWYGYPTIQEYGDVSFVAPSGTIQWYADWPGAPSCADTTPVTLTVSYLT